MFRLPVPVTAFGSLWTSRSPAWHPTWDGAPIYNCYMRHFTRKAAAADASGIVHSGVSSATTTTLLPCTTRHDSQAPSSQT